MTVAGWFLLGAFTFGPVVGLAFYILLVERVRVRAARDARLIAAAEAGRRNAPFTGNARRSPDHQLVTREMPPPGVRPVLHDRPPRSPSVFPPPF